MKAEKPIQKSLLYQKFQRNLKKSKFSHNKIPFFAGTPPQNERKMRKYEQIWNGNPTGFNSESNRTESISTIEGKEGSTLLLTCQHYRLILLYSTIFSSLKNYTILRIFILNSNAPAQNSVNEPKVSRLKKFYRNI